MNKPNLFIVGAPKSGTTALWEYLRAHPDIYMSTVKELNYFGSDIKTYSPYHNSLKTYLKWFTKAQKEKIIGEASVWYLYSETAAKEIYKFNPKSKIIIMLRNPADLIQSLHSEFLFKGYEDQPDLKRALMLEKERRKGHSIPKICRLPKVLFYSEVVNFYPQVKRYVDLFGKERVKIVIFEEFISDTPKRFREILEFIDVDTNYSPEFRKVNESKAVRSTVVRNIFQNPPKFILPIYEFFVPKRLRPKLISSILQINSKKVDKTPLDSEIRNEILKNQAGNISKLSKLTKRDFKLWGHRFS